MLQKRWKIRKVEDEYSLKFLAESLNISDVLAKLLLLRGIKTFSQAKSFFRPSLDTLHDPFLMDGMEAATKRVIKAITENQPICIYGDYDVDGTCATSLMFMFLKELGANVNFYIPKRLTEGYGLSKESIDAIKSTQNASLLISVDCGITAIEETDYANSLGMDVIICDHHQPKDEIPKALAVLDPLKPQCNYPFDYLSGAGVAFKLAQGISEKIGRREMPFKYLDLVALAGAADIVPLIDENRVLVKEGLDRINTNPRPGIQALIESSSLQPGNLNSGQVVFTLAPRINAVGRLGDAGRAVELLITDSKDEALSLAKVLETENYARRKIDGNTFDDALQLVENSIDLENELAIVLHQEEWHPGVIGIVASRLVEKYYRPTIMLTTIDGIAKGSARSISNFNIYEALQKCEDMLIHFGGHQAAAGLAVELDKVKEFKDKFNQIVRESITEEDLLPEVIIDAKIKFSEITPKFLRILDQFSPFGPLNMRPVFITENVEASNSPRLVGNNHLIACFRQNGNDKILDSIGFNMREYIDIFAEKNKKVDIVYTIDKITRDGRSYPQLRLKDIRPSENNSITEKENKENL
jgi:single-stranded-DNA-specific exonuclease